MNSKLRRFLECQKCCITCNMCSWVLPDMSALALGRCVPSDSCIHIRQIPPGHVTYITCKPILESSLTRYDKPVSVISVYSLCCSLTCTTVQARAASYFSVWPTHVIANAAFHDSRKGIMVVSSSPKSTSMCETVGFGPEGKEFP